MVSYKSYHFRKLRKDAPNVEVKSKVTNGTTWITRGATLVAIIIVLVVIVTMKKDVEPDLFYFPRPTFFFCSGIYLVIPILWIILNPELRWEYQLYSSVRKYKFRSYAKRQVSNQTLRLKKKNKIHPLKKSAIQADYPVVHDVGSSSIMIPSLSYSLSLSSVV